MSTTYTVDYEPGADASRPWALISDDGGCTTEVVSRHPSRPSAYRAAVKRAHADAAADRYHARYVRAYEADRARAREWARMVTP